MISTNALLLCDTYKCCHDRMYPNNLKTLVSYWVPRKSMFKNEESQKMVFFGLQAFIQEYLVEYFNKNFFKVPLDEVLISNRLRLASRLSPRHTVDLLAYFKYFRSSSIEKLSPVTSGLSNSTTSYACNKALNSFVLVLLSSMSSSTLWSILNIILSSLLLFK